MSSVHIYTAAPAQNGGQGGMPGGYGATQGSGPGLAVPGAAGGGNGGGGGRRRRRSSRRYSSSSSDSRSRSRSRHDHGSPPEEYMRWRADKEREDIIAEYKKREVEEAERTKAAIVAQKLKEEKAQQERDQAQKAAVEKWKEDQRKEKEDRKRIAEDWEREQKEKKEKEDQEYKDRVAKDLAKFGFKDNQVDAIVNHKDPNAGALVPGGARQPTCPKVNKQYLEEKTLKKSKLPYHQDEHDPNMWCIDTPVSDEMLQSMFAHTREIRRRREEERKQQLAADDEKERHGRKKDDNRFVQIRKVSRSRSRNRDKSPARGEGLSGPEKLVEKLFLR